MNDDLKKVIIEVMKKDEKTKDFEIKCQFNPTKMVVTKSSKWAAKGRGSTQQNKDNTPKRNAPELDFGGGKSASFDLDLLFDTSRFESKSERDVRTYTNPLLGLTLKRDKDNPPPVVRVVWGELQFFKAVVTKVAVTYTLFDSNGLPVRATAKVDFKQKDASDDVVQGQNPTSRTEARQTRLVKHGDRLDLIAYEEYRHVAYWRYLAEVNNLWDPRDLRPGQILVVPPLP